MANLRAEYEREVRALAAQGEAMRAEGAGAEAIARALHAVRREIGARYKAATPEPLRASLIARTVSVYGDPLGPGIDHLRAAGRSWHEIAEAATRPGPFPPR